MIQKNSKKKSKPFWVKFSVLLNLKCFWTFFFFHQKATKNSFLYPKSCNNFPYKISQKVTESVLLTVKDCVIWSAMWLSFVNF